MNYREQYEGLESYLTQRGFSSVCNQVREELAAGKLTEERITTVTEIKRDEQLWLVTRDNFKKGQSAEFVKRNEYTDKESLILLLEAARRAICDSAVMADELKSAFKNDGIDEISFEGESPEQSSFALHFDDNEIGSLARDSALKMDALIEQFRGA